MKFEDAITIQAPAEQIFSVYTKVADWPVWDTGTESASIDGAFALGATGKIKPKGEPETPIEWIEMTANKSFTVECKIPLCKMQFVHELDAEGDGTRVKNVVIFSGLMSRVYAFLFGKKLQKGMEESLQGLKQHIEGAK
jgi:uncharacterized membrane protein